MTAATTHPSEVDSEPGTPKVPTPKEPDDERKRFLDSLMILGKNDFRRKSFDKRHVVTGFLQLQACVRELEGTIDVMKAHSKDREKGVSVLTEELRQVKEYYGKVIARIADLEGELERSKERVEELDSLVSDQRDLLDQVGAIGRGLELVASSLFRKLRDGLAAKWQISRGEVAEAKIIQCAFQALDDISRD